MFISFLLVLSPGLETILFNHYPVESLPNASYNLVKIHPELESIELDDGSLWSLSLYDYPKIRDWSENQAVCITQNTRWFTSYPYRLVNRRNGAFVEVKLLEQPLQGGEKTHYISMLDVANSSIVLSNGSLWKINPKDMPIVKKWDVSSPFPVIIGHNSESAPSDEEEWEQILIEVTNPSNIVQAHQVF